MDTLSFRSTGFFIARISSDWCYKRGFYHGLCIDDNAKSKMNTQVPLTLTLEDGTGETFIVISCYVWCCMFDDEMSYMT